MNTELKQTYRVWFDPYRSMPKRGYDIRAATQREVADLYEAKQLRVVSLGIGPGSYTYSLGLVDWFGASLRAGSTIELPAFRIHGHHRCYAGRETELRLRIQALLLEWLHRHAPVGRPLVDMWRGVK